MEFEFKKNTKIGIVYEVISSKDVSERFLFFLTRPVTPKLFIECKIHINIRDARRSRRINLTQYSSPLN